MSASSGSGRRRPLLLSLFLLCAVAPTMPARADDPAFRTDDGKDDKLPWFQLKPGEFPPDGSAHAISGELIALDHLNRTGVLRPDRTDAQRVDDFDIPLPFAMLPYGTIRYHGAPAELRDVPIGTHLRGEFYLGEKADPTGKAKGAFSRVSRLEDDFSFDSRRGRLWRIEAVDSGKGMLTVTAASGPETRPATEPTTEPATKPAVKPIVYKLTPATRVWNGRTVAAPADVAPGQSVLLNLTACTLKGPGRCTDVWVDGTSREVAAAQQLEVHRQYQREHGLAGWVDAVDNRAGTVTVALFAGVDESLVKEIRPKSSVAAAVAEASLRTYDQINDVGRGPVLDVGQVPPAGAGDAGVRVTYKPEFLLEGYRPRRFVRLFAGGWKVDDLPKEERLYE